MKTIKAILDGSISKPELQEWIIKNYFLKGWALSDFEDDLFMKFGLSDADAVTAKKQLLAILAK